MDYFKQFLLICSDFTLLLFGPKRIWGLQEISHFYCGEDEINQITEESPARD